MEKKLEKLFQNNTWNKITCVIFPIALICFSFMHIGTGITITDTGYNYGNFVFFDRLDDMWKFSTYIANVIGNLFTKLPFGYSMIGLNFYTGLFKILAALFAYFFCVRICQMRRELVFVGELIALGFCWCPTALIYNYLTYFLFNVAAMLLYVAIVKEKKKLFFLAGVILGLNLFVRLPNLAECALILAVWFAGIVKKSTIKSIIADTLYCVGGYLATVICLFGYIACRYGIDRYLNGIQEIFSMTENATSYSPLTMLTSNIGAYFDYIPWFALGLFLIVCGMILFKIFGKKLVFLKKIMICGMMAVYVLFLFYKRNFTIKYTDYSSMFFWGVMFSIFILGYCLFVVFDVKQNYEIKILAMINIIIVLITPIGSNNTLFSTINNLFLAAPMVVHFIGTMVLSAKENIEIKKLAISIFPLKMFCVTIIGMVLLQSFLFGVNFVFRDGLDGEQRNYKIENNNVLKGMHTTKENAEQLQGINDYLAENNLIDKEVILFGEIPATAFYFSLEPAISSTWPDLPSFTAEKFCKEIDEIEQEKRNPMVIVRGIDVVNIQAYAKVDEVQTEWEKKIKRLQLFLDDNNYVQCYTSEGFVVYKND